MLVVDDEAAIRETFSRMLEHGGYQPITAASGEAALPVLQHGLRPAAILLDLKMPGQGGLGFLIALRADARFASIPVAIVTGDSFVDTSTEWVAHRLGASLHFKPMSFRALLDLTMRLVTAAEPTGRGENVCPRVVG